ncbi:MAG: hypothetical protein K9L60_06430 [Methylovulum sp.]|jgi:hypothetical protein|nr:hypothetical protein [Methylovulum sp.]MCF7998878.1 hypothetical protein [Methylovulum sp.]
MKNTTFKDWDLDKLDNAFNLKQVWQSELLAQWQNNNETVDEFEKRTLQQLQKSLIRGGRAWNEVELENKFISPVIMAADIDDEEIGYFLERPLSGVVGDYELSGIVDGVIATGVRNPHTPYFCFNEYKRSVENQGTPDAQVLAAMLVAREINHNHTPIYGLFVVGLAWNFVVLNNNDYCISKNYNADDEEIFVIFKMLKALKKIIKTELIEL